MLTTRYGTFRERSCWHPRGHASYAVAYFFTFALFAGFILTSLFIGAVTGGMAEALQEFEDEQGELQKKRELKSTSIVDPK